LITATKYRELVNQMKVKSIAYNASQKKLIKVLLKRPNKRKKKKLSRIRLLVLKIKKEVKIKNILPKCKNK